ncbi:MAG TPA: AraC family transcriptional regulator [Actinophytocola sp.]|uniref:AraC family transcriptional regulator n=1 Tax=Actinophytocola sp. TaxID=1872138 RepID=UPI002DB87BBC|nr:AraC family transcriptional regulator [Actinophytocola sp.]HEU5475583.1 AraC family transcriptional regulator [Actinophytocola sp.]
MDEIVVRAVERAIDTMRTNLGDRLTIDDLARSAMFSKFHFTRVFQRITGVSPGRFLSAMRLEEAKRLLLTTGLTVADISHRVGYNSVGTFSSRFRHSVGVSPTTYRQFAGSPTALPVDEQPATGARGTVRGTVIAPPDTHPKLIFVGLFPSRILEASAIRTTLLRQPGPYTLHDVPPGTWHLLAHAPTDPVPQVGNHGTISIHAQVTARIADIYLRPVSTLDPPVLMAMHDGPPAALTKAAS